MRQGTKASAETGAAPSVQETHLQWEAACVRAVFAKETYFVQALTGGFFLVLSGARSFPPSLVCSRRGDSM